jgi:hypothetical protein
MKKFPQDLKIIMGIKPDDKKQENFLKKLKDDKEKISEIMRLSDTKALNYFQENLKIITNDIESNKKETIILKIFFSNILLNLK